MKPEDSHPFGGFICHPTMAQNFSTSRSFPKGQIALKIMPGEIIGPLQVR